MGQFARAPFMGAVQVGMQEGDGDALEAILGGPRQPRGQRRLVQRRHHLARRHRGRRQARHRRAGPARRHRPADLAGRHPAGLARPGCSPERSVQ